MVTTSVDGRIAERLTAEDYKAAIAEPDNEERFNAFLGKLSTFEVVEGGALRRYYIVEGDLKLTREQVRAVLKARKSERVEATKTRLSPELIIATLNGKDQFWPKGKRSLTYAIDKKSFTANLPAAKAEELYSAVSTNFKAAAEAWVTACASCGISFTHSAASDSAPREGQVTFIIRYSKEIRPEVALAFFPYEPPRQRYLYVFPGYATTPYDPVGVFRHEIGHILGYRHEMLASGAGCHQTEEGTWRPLTPYDSKSVMHYYCGNSAQLELKLSDTDKSSHSAMYKVIS
ncbi:hypothetical protein [Sphingobium yanoikuyae]|nr:hypothetical protein [Sphingobium yanoikuyae]